VFVGVNALLAAFSYLFIVGEIKRIELKGETPAATDPADGAVNPVR
jgi:ACS family glucarate transporter-like MFS transporter